MIPYSPLHAVLQYVVLNITFPKQRFCLHFVVLHAETLSMYTLLRTFNGFILCLVDINFDLIVVLCASTTTISAANVCNGISLKIKKKKRFKKSFLNLNYTFFPQANPINSEKPGGVAQIQEQEELKNALIGAQESAAVQMLLEICLPTEADKVRANYFYFFSRISID